MIDVQKAAIALDLPVATVTAMICLVENIRSIGAKSAIPKSLPDPNRVGELLSSLEAEYSQKL